MITLKIAIDGLLNDKGWDRLTDSVEDADILGAIRDALIAEEIPEEIIDALKITIEIT